MPTHQILSFGNPTSSKKKTPTQENKQTEISTSLILTFLPVSGMFTVG